MGLPLIDLVTVAEHVAATSSRKAKGELLADLLRRCSEAELAVVVGFLTGDLQQGRIGVGWAFLDGLAVDSAIEPSVHVVEVDEALNDVAAIGGSGSRQRREDVLMPLLRRMTADESAFVRAVLVGGLRLGSLEGVMIDGIAKANDVPAAVVRRAAMLSGDLGATAQIAQHRGREGLEGVGLRLLRGVQPMLASTSATTSEAVSELGGEVCVQAKLDGIRIQAHRSDDEVRLFTRNLNDVTERLPAVVSMVRALPVTSVVLDGEVVGMTNDSPEMFQDTASTFSSGGSSGRVDLSVQFFDILHRDGSDLIDLPLRQRLMELVDVVGDAAVEGVTTSDAGTAEAFNERVLSRGLEGVMVKDLSSPYAAGRRGKTWRKVKPVHTYDLVVLAAEWGHGRRTGRLSNLHLGARHGDDFVMVGKTFKGLTDLVLEWQTEAILAREVRRDGITVFARPELVVEIAIDGVQRSTTYPGGLALRFARVRGYRDDKPAAEADTLDMLLERLK